MALDVIVEDSLVVDQEMFDWKDGIAIKGWHTNWEGDCEQDHWMLCYNRTCGRHDASKEKHKYYPTGKWETANLKVPLLTFLVTQWRNSRSRSAGLTHRFVVRQTQEVATDGAVFVEQMGIDYRLSGFGSWRMVSCWQAAYDKNSGEYLGRHDMVFVDFKVADSFEVVDTSYGIFGEQVVIMKVDVMM